MSIFFDAFWPNLAATILGVALGIPIALFLNRHLFEHQRKIEADQTRRRLGDAIEVLIGSCDYNIKVLNQMCEFALVGRVMHNPDLRLTSWDAVGGVISHSCSDPNLLQMLSHHWLRLNRLQALNDEMFSREISKSLPAFEDKYIARELWKVFHDNALSLSVHAAKAAQRLQELKAGDGVPFEPKREGSSLPTHHPR